MEFHAALQERLYYFYGDFLKKYFYLYITRYQLLSFIYNGSNHDYATFFPIIKYIINIKHN